MHTPEIIGASAAITAAKQRAETLAVTNLPICLLGESGTGKDVFARYIHSKSSRAGKPFEPLNCGRLSSEFISSELFGHEKGAFTSAHKQRRGVFERADGGTAFLNEIGVLTCDLQVHLLDVLEGNPFTRLGGEQAIQPTFRLIFATNEDLKSAVEKGSFREDP